MFFLRVRMRRDMRVGNIMEHRADAEMVLPKGFSGGNKKRSTFKLPGARGSKPEPLTAECLGVDLLLLLHLLDVLLVIYSGQSTDVCNLCRRQAGGCAEVCHH